MHSSSVQQLWRARPGAELRTSGRCDTCHAMGGPGEAGPEPGPEAAAAELEARLEAERARLQGNARFRAK